MIQTTETPIRCRLAACREDLDDGQSWSFYLINDHDAALDLAVLYEISSEWGDMGQMATADVRVSDLAPGACALLWRDDGELRTELSLLVQLAARMLLLTFEFPRLYRQGNLPLVAGLDKPGLEGSLVRTQSVRRGPACDCVSSDC